MTPTSDPQEPVTADLATIRRSLPAIVGPNTAELWVAFGRIERALGHGIYAAASPDSAPAGLACGCDECDDGCTVGPDGVSVGSDGDLPGFCADCSNDDIPEGYPCHLASATAALIELPIRTFGGANRYDTQDEHVLSLWADGQTWDLRVSRGEAR